jgi:xanthine dehydrogenase accessory factor
MTPEEFDELHRALAGWPVAAGDDGVRAALATIVRTRGSTFRRTGARMLVRADGTVVRGLSGGCPEQDIIGHARRVIASGQSQIVRYHRDSGFDVMMEMGCGGELDVLIEPIAGGRGAAFLDTVQRMFERRASGWLATAFAVDGECMPSGPVHMVVADDGLDGEETFPASFAMSGLVGEPKTITPALRDHLRSIFASERSPVDGRVLRYEIDGRVIDVLVERLVPPHAVVLIGANASSLALARTAVQLGWKTTVVDPRPGDATVHGWPTPVQLLHADADALQRRVAFDERTSVVVMTHHLERDLAYLGVLRDHRLAYLGAIGSRERATRVLQTIVRTSTPLRTPAGLDIGSETPEEIALAIAAEILAVLAGRSGSPLSSIEQAIH